MTDSAQSAGHWLRMAFIVAASAALGFALAKSLVDLHREARLSAWSDFGALFLAVALAGQGAFVMLLSFNRSAAGAAFGGGRPASDAQLSFYRQQAGVLLLAGMMLAAPVAVALIAPAAQAPQLALAAMIAIVVCFALQTALNLVVWRRADEFVRRLISETSSLCFWVLQAALFLWAAGERLGLLPAVDAWDCVVVMMSVYLLASGFVSVRNGVGTHGGS
jgi:hypothetical protein